jgi:glycosyltransferase involved in cell wall biosynthesis
MRDEKPDLVHTHLFGDSLHGYLASRLAGGIPTVMTLHSMERLHSGLQRAGYRWLLRRAQRAVACSEAVRRSFLDELSGNAVAIETILNGVEAETCAVDRSAARAALGYPEDGLVVGAIGRLAEEKNFADLIRAMAILGEDRRGARLVLLGEGPLRESLRACAAEEGLVHVVDFPGFRRDVRDLLPALDVVVFSSLGEGLPMALLEAMAAGRCIVATDVGGIGEAVRSGQEALLVVPRDASALAAALRTALADEDLRRRLGNSAQRRFLDQFTARRMADRYAAVYDVALTPHGPACSLRKTAGGWSAS